MATTLTLRHERVDDIPVIIGLANQLPFGWLAYILSQGDHRQSTVREWANSLPHTLERLLGQPLREVEFSDDRLSGILRRLSDEEAWEAIEEDLWAATMVVYELELTGIRLDSTTSYGYHQVTEEGVMPFGPSKDHRPDLPQVKVMLSALDPLGLPVATDVVPGQRADDPLYVPAIIRVRESLGRRGLLDVGDCKMGAVETRAFIQAGGD